MSRITITIATPDTLDTKDFVFEVDDALNMGFKHEFYMWTIEPKRGRWIAGAEVIRCKDCVHSDTFPKGADNDMPLKCLGIRYGGVMPDWYCEHAERREEGR